MATENLFLTHADVTLRLINKEIQAVSGFALEAGIEPHDLRNMNGDWTLIPLLNAKANVLLAMHDSQPKTTIINHICGAKTEDDPNVRV